MSSSGTGDAPRGREADLASLSSITAGIAHEIRNPLHFIQNYAAVVGELGRELADILEEAHGHLPRPTNDDLASLRDELTEAGDQIVRHADRLDAIVESMRATSRGGAGRRSLADVNRLVGESAELALRGLPGLAPLALGEPLSVELDPELPPVMVDALRLSQAVINLVTNALQATAGGTFDGEEPRVTVRTSRVADRAVIVVEDNGPGIPPELGERVFEPFFSTKAGRVNAGLGLSQVWDIVVGDHDGAVRVDSVEGGPTQITVEIPLT